MKPPPEGDDRNLRYVRFGGGYELRTWDTYRTSRRWNKSIVGYALYEPGRRSPLFSGEDFEVSPNMAIDSDSALRSLLAFLTLRPGDTDAEYFDGYTGRQRAFAEGDAELLQEYADEDGPAFDDLDGREPDDEEDDPEDVTFDEEDDEEEDDPEDVNFDDD